MAPRVCEILFVNGLGSRWSWGEDGRRDGLKQRPGNLAGAGRCRQRCLRGGSLGVVLLR
jgi:hypothetical protein